MQHTTLIEMKDKNLYDHLSRFRKKSTSPFMIKTLNNNGIRNVTQHNKGHI